MVILDEYRHVTRFAQNSVSTFKNSDWPNEKFFRALIMILDEYRHVTRFAQKGVPTFKDSDWPKAKVFSDLSSDFEWV